MTRNLPDGNPVHAVLFATTVIKTYITLPIATLKFCEYPKIVLNYEKLNADDNTRVPVTSYNQARLLVEVDNESKSTAEVKEAESKN